MSAQTHPSLEHCYIDGFSGAGLHVSRATGSVVEGSPMVALSVVPPFRRFFFVDLSSRKVSHLRALVGDRKDIEVFEGDCNQVLLTEVFPRVRFAAYQRALCVLDPYGLHLDWRVIEAAGHARSIEIFLNFPVMDANMNALWKTRDPQAPGADRMTAIWGDRSWLDAAYAPDPQTHLFGAGEPLKRGNDAIAAAFRRRLHDAAGFRFVPEPIPMRNSRNAVVYYLFFASQNRTGETIVTWLFDRYRDHRG